MATIVYLIQTIIYVGMVVYAPSLALETVTGLGKWASVWLTGTICIFYTSIGGLKAVVWTDTIQLFIMMSGFLGIIIKGPVSSLKPISSKPPCCLESFKRWYRSRSGCSY